MTGLEMLLAEFNESNLPDDLIEKFRQLIPALLELPDPVKLQALRRLVEVRRIAVRRRAH